MLKAQLGSKLHALHANWRNIEDILTGDFFGALDYLPRVPYLQDFVRLIGHLNPAVETPDSETVDWNDTAVLFWHRVITDSAGAEPDVVIVSNKWVIVIEVKLDADLGDTQPSREYAAGQSIAAEHALPATSVYYVLLARERPALKGPDAAKLAKLSYVTSYLEWHQVVSLVDSWRRLRPRTPEVDPSHSRLLSDLLAALRRRRAIAFSGFALANLTAVSRPSANLFCPPLFSGFLQRSRLVNPLRQSAILFSPFCGFLHTSRTVAQQDSVFLQGLFHGFACNCPPVQRAAADPIFLSSFAGFLNRARRCAPPCHQFLKGSAV